MKLTPPKAATFWISVLLVVIGVAASVVSIPFVSSYYLAVVVIGFVLLALGNMVKGL
jgi:threonine/homoserine/homoserine lactone efflux protein